MAAFSGGRSEYASVQVVDFMPSARSAFTFQATLDGAAHTVVVSWNVFGERYYVNVYTLRQARICTLPMVGSPNDADINILGGYFTTMLVYRTGMQRFEILSDPLS